MDQTLARRTLQELIKREDLENKKCIDCSNPNPQWASLRFAPAHRIMIPSLIQLVMTPLQLWSLPLFAMRWRP